ncbi:30S ribosomal protein S13 [Candidatus Woesebacteria bacterium]|nr:30S ribosomal protein S13 [Candidatus Woesebacteria bacterium]
MARIAGVELQDNIRIDYALTLIKGIGWSLSKKILDYLEISRGKRIKDLTPGQLSNIAAKVEEYRVEGELVRKVTSDIQRLKTISSYRGLRHSRNLPVRGQRTRSNARTKRGKRKTVGAFKKEELAKKVSIVKEENK